MDGNMKTYSGVYGTLTKEEHEYFYTGMGIYEIENHLKRRLTPENYPPVEIDHHGLIWKEKPVVVNPLQHYKEKRVVINTFQCYNLMKRLEWWEKEGRFISPNELV